MGEILMKQLLIVTVVFFVAGCGTMYDLPKYGESELARAQLLMVEGQSTGGRSKPLTPRLAAAHYKRVVKRVEPIAEKFCRSQTADREGFDCDFQIVIDPDLNATANAFQTVNAQNEPIIIFNIQFIADARNPDELAFVLGHEAGHHIAEHLEKQQKQQITGALIMGVLTAVSQSYQTQANPYRSTAYDQIELQNNMATGASLGGIAFSQTYELEADMIGTYIAESAGYNPEKGALIFARRENPKNVNGSLSFWGTHPPSVDRIAIVISTLNQIKEQRLSAGQGVSETLCMALSPCS